MKKVLILMLVVFMGVFLFACSGEENEEANLIIDNKTFTLYEEDYSIYDGRFTYKTAIDEKEESTKYIFIFPDSSTWSIDVKTGAETGRVEHSEDYGDPRYATGEELYDVYTRLKPTLEENNDGIFNIDFTAPKVILTALFLGIGILLVAAPYKVWRISQGWKFEGEVEPSDAYIGSTVAAGVFSIIIAVVIFLFVQFPFA